jgi:hypothetical protein
LTGSKANPPNLAAGSTLSPRRKEFRIFGLSVRHSDSYKDALADSGPASGERLAGSFKGARPQGFFMFFQRGNRSLSRKKSRV